MAFMIKGIIDLKGILILMLLTVTSQATNLECYGKAFHCVNSTHFMICVDLGRGTSTTIDDVIIPCPSPTVCRRTNRFECEFPLPTVPSTTTATTELPTTVTTESEVTTFAPLPTNSIPFEEYFNTVSTTTISQTELQTSLTDNLLSVKPITEGPHTTVLFTTEKVITEKSILSDVNTTVTDGKLSNNVTLSDNNGIDIESNNTLNLDVIPKDVISVNNSQALTQAQETELLKFNTEHNGLDNSTSSDFTSTRSVHEVNTENVITTEFGVTLENITETNIVSGINEEPLNISATQISSAVTEQTVTTEQNFVKSFQDATPASTLHTTTALLETSITPETTQTATQIIKLQSVTDIANTAEGNFNYVSEILVNSSSTDVTGVLPDTTVNIEQNFTNNFQEVTVNATIPDYFSTLPSITAPSDSTRDVNKVNASQSSRDMNNNVTDNNSDVSITQEGTTNIVPSDIDQLDTRLTESSTLNSNLTTPGIPHDSLPEIIAMSETTRTIEPTSTKDLLEALVNATEITFINTEATVNTISLDFTSTVTEQTVTKDQTLIKVLEEPLHLNNFSAVPNIISTVYKPHVDIINTSKPVNDIIDIGPTGFSGLNGSRNTTTNLVGTIIEYNTLATDLPVENHLENMTPVVLTTAKASTVNTTDDPNYQEFPQTHQPQLPTITTPTQIILSNSSLDPELVMPTISAKEDIREVINVSVSDNVRILDLSITTDSVVTADTEITDRNNKSMDNFSNNYVQIKQDNIFQSNVTDDNQGSFTTYVTVPELITKPQFKTTNNLENGSIAIEAATVRTIIGESLDTEIPKTSDYLTSSTTKSTAGIEVTTISFNNLEIVTNKITTPTTSITTEKNAMELQGGAETIGNDFNNKVGNATRRITPNEKVLFTNDPDFKPSTQAHNINTSNKTERSAFSPLPKESPTSMLQLLINEDNPKLKGNIKEAGYELSTESTILPTESFLSQPVVNENSISKNDPYEINYVTSTVLYDNSGDTLLDGQIKTVTDRTSTRNETDSVHIVDSLLPVKDHKANASSTYQHYKATVTTTEITTLSPSITIVDQNKNVSSEQTNTLQQTGASINTSTPLFSTTIATTEVAYVSLDYNYEERSSFQEEPTTNSIIDQTEIQTETQSADSHKKYVKNIDEFAIKSEVLLNIEKNTYDTTKQHATVASYTFSDMPLSTDPALESITPGIVEGITMANTAELTATTVKYNGYSSSSHDVLINVPSTTANNLLETPTLTSELNQSNVGQILISAQDIIATESPKISNNSSSNVNVQSAAVTYLTVSTDRTFNADESTMPASLKTDMYLQNLKDSLSTNLSTSSDPPTKYQESILSTTNRKPDLNTQSSTSRNDVVTVPDETIIRVTTAVPGIEITPISILKEDTIVSNGPTIETSLPENNALNFEPDSIFINQNTVTLNTHIQRDINTPITTQAFIQESVSAATTEIPVIVNTVNYQNSTIKVSLKEEPADVHLNQNKLIQQTNPLENITLNSLTLVAASNQEPASVTHSDLHETIFTIGKRDDESSTSVNSLTEDKNTRKTSPTNSKKYSSQTSTSETKLSSEGSYSVTTSNLNKEHNQPLIDYLTPRTTILRPSGLVISVTSPLQTTTLPPSDDLNVQNSNSLQTPTNNNLDFVNPNIVSQFVTKSIKKDVPGMTEITHVTVNHDEKNEDVISSVDYGTLSITLPATASSYSVTNPIPSLPIELDILFKRGRTTVSGAAIIPPTNNVGLSTIAQLALSQTESPESSNNNDQVPQTPSSQITKSVISTTASLDTNREVPLKTTYHVANIEPTIRPARRDLITVDDTLLFIDDKKTEQNKILTAATEISTGKSTDSLKIKTNDYITHNTETATKPETTRDSTVQITASGVQNMKSNKDNDKSTLSVSLTDYGVPTEAITTADVIVNSKIEREKTHSGIISFITPPPEFRASKEKKENTEKKKTEAEEQQERPINVELVSLQDTLTLPTKIPTAAQIGNGSKAQRDISNKEELLIKIKNIDYKTTNGTRTEQRVATKNITIEYILNGTNTTVSGYKKETPTHEKTIPPTNDSHTSNNKSQDQNMSIPQAHNKSVIFNDQSSTSRYVPQTKSTAAADTQTTGFPALETTTHKEPNKFSCKQKKRGRYADELDCRKFYICPGNKSSHIIEGTCPVNTVFSEINKQCTKNLSHCVRNNQFRCVTEGRFSDFLNNNIYYICVKNNLSHFIRFKLQCQNGYHINKTSVRCALNTESTSMSESKGGASEQSSSLTTQDTTEKSEKKFKCKKEGVFPDPSNCNKYFECTKIDSTYRQKRKKCDSDETFHKDKKKCVDSDSYECYT